MQVANVDGDGPHLTGLQQLGQAEVFRTWLARQPRFGPKARGAAFQEWAASKRFSPGDRREIWKRVLGLDGDDDAPGLDQ